MGIALVVPGISFSGANLGTVTPTGNIPITGLGINGPNTVSGNVEAATFTPVFTPSNTSQRSVSWSIVSGSAYASIDASTGILSVLPGANAASVTIRVTSVANSNVYANKTIAVTYAGQFEPIEDLVGRINFPHNDGNGGYYVTNIVPDSGDWFKIKVTRFGDRLSFFFGSRQLSNADDDTISIERDADSHLVVKLFGKKFVSSGQMVSGTPYVIQAKSSGITVSPSLGTFTETTYSYNQAYKLVIAACGYANNTVGLNTGPGDIYAIEVYGSNNVLKHRLVAQSDLTFKDEVTNSIYSKTGGGEVLYGNT